MFYYTISAPEVTHQMTLDELFSGEIKFSYSNTKGTNTRTYCVDRIPDSALLKISVDVNKIIKSLADFNSEWGYLKEADRHSLYREFYIPKRSHGYRKIDAPNEELMNALRELKIILEDVCHASYHTAAFAYIKKRNVVDALKRHQANESKWFGKYDLSNFFGNTTFEFVMRQLSMIYPFSEVMKRDDGIRELQNAIELGFLDGGLPQGTPLSPTITNLIMIPIDHALAKELHDFDKNRFIYTRYADDFLVSCKYTFDYRKVEGLINSVMERFNAPYKLNGEKTRYGSSAGQNWNLGLMLNKDNEITVGHKRKRELKAALNSYILDKIHGICWELGDVQVLHGQLNYCLQIEPDSIKKILCKYEEKYAFNVEAELRRDLKVQNN